MREISRQWFSKKTVWNQQANCFPISKSNCWDILEGNDMSWIRLEKPVWRPCIRCMSTMAYFQAIRREETRSINVTLEVRKCFSEMSQASSFCHDEAAHVHTSLGRKNANDCLNDLFLPHYQSFLEESQLISTSLLGKIYNLFGFAPPQNLYLGKPKLLK